jgi:hypothetical protein
MSNLAFCLQASDGAAAALPLYRRAVDSCQRVLGPEHPDTLVSVSNLAMCLQTLGDAAALPLFRQALDGRERVLGSLHPDTLVSVSNLAMCLQTLGDAAARGRPLRQTRATKAEIEPSAKQWWRRLFG